MVRRPIGDEGHRSPYLSHAKRSLYHLSYIPFMCCLLSVSVYVSKFMLMFLVAVARFFFPMATPMIVSARSIFLPLHSHTAPVQGRSCRRSVVLWALGSSPSEPLSKDEYQLQEAFRRLQEELSNGNDRKALEVANSLRAFGAARQVPQRIYTLEELRLNNIDTSRFLSPVDFTLGNVRRNLQIAAVAGGVVAWQALSLDQTQLLIIIVIVLFIGTFDQIANGGGVEALILDTLGRLLSRKYKERVTQHEAGHFLVAYLLGILPQDYTLSCLDAFKKQGSLNIQAGTTFVDFSFREEVESGKLSSGTLSKYACVALAGVATEYLKFGLAEGGLSDIQQLDGLLKRLNFTQLKADSQVRWAVLNTVTILRRHMGLHAKLALAMDAGKTVGECIQLIESELATCTDV